MAATLPFPYLEVANITFVVPVMDEPVVNILPEAAAFLVGLKVMVVPLNHSASATLPILPLMMESVRFVVTLKLAPEIFTRSNAIPNGFVSTVLLVNRSFQIWGE